MSFNKILYSSKKSIYEYIDDDGENNINILLNIVKTEYLTIIVKSGILHLKYTLNNSKLKHLTILNPVVNDYDLVDTSRDNDDEAVDYSAKSQTDIDWGNYMHKLYNSYPTKQFYTQDNPSVISLDIVDKFFKDAPTIYIEFYELAAHNREKPIMLQNIDIKGLNIQKCFTNVRINANICRVSNIKCDSISLTCSSLSNIHHIYSLSTRILLDKYTRINNTQSVHQHDSYFNVKNIIEIDNAKRVVVSSNVEKLITNNCHEVILWSTDIAEINGDNTIVHAQAADINSILNIQGKNIHIQFIAFYDVNNVYITDKENYIDKLIDYNYWDNYKINFDDEQYIQTMLHKLKNNTITRVNHLYEKLQTKYNTMYAGHVREENTQYISANTEFLESSPLYIKTESINYLMDLPRAAIVKIINNLLHKRNILLISNKLSQSCKPEWTQDISVHYKYKFVFSTLKSRVVELLENMKIPKQLIDYRGYYRSVHLNLKLFTNTRWNEYYSNGLQTRDVSVLSELVPLNMCNYKMLVNNPNKIVDILKINKKSTCDINNIMRVLMFFVKELSDETIMFLYSTLNPSNPSIIKQFIELTSDTIVRNMSNEEFISSIPDTTKNILIRQGILPGNNFSRFNNTLFSSILTRKLITKSKLDINKIKSIKNSISNSNIKSYLGWTIGKNISEYNLDADLTKLDNLPEWAKCSNYWYENVADEHASQKLNQGGYKFRVNSFDYKTLQLPLDNGVTDAYITRSHHLGNEINLTVGWVRYNIDRINNTIWINEIQTDLTKLLIKNTIVEMNPILIYLSNKIYNEMSLIVLEIFLQWCSKEFNEIEIVAPSAELRTDIIGGNPTVSVYDNNLKKCNFKKQPFNKTIWCTYRNKESAHIESSVYVYKI